MSVQCGKLMIIHVDAHILCCLNDRSPLTPLPPPSPCPSAPIQMNTHRYGSRFQSCQLSLNIYPPLDKNAAKNSTAGTVSLWNSVTFRMYVWSQSGTFQSLRRTYVLIREIILHHGMMATLLCTTCLKPLQSVARRWQRGQVRRVIFVMSMRDGIVTNGILPLKKTITTNRSTQKGRVPIQG